MSLYGRVDGNQGSVFGSLMSSQGIPAWLLAIALYLAMITVINKAPIFVLLLDHKPLGAERVRVFIGTSSALISAAALLLFVLRRYTFCIYYLVVMAILDLMLTISDIAGGIDYLDFYFYSSRGLDSIPYKIIELTTDVVGIGAGWNNIGSAGINVVKIAGPAASLAVCALLLYFHKKSSARSRI